MAIEVKLVSLGVSITEGTIVRWLKKEGDLVEKGEAVAEVETQKVDFEIYAPESGTLLKVLFPEQTMVKVDTIIALIGDLGEDVSIYSSKMASKEEAPIKEPEARVDIGKRPKTMTQTKAFPAAKMLAKKEGIDITQVQGTGPEGQITKDDVVRYVKDRGQSGDDDRIPELEDILPLVGIRKTIADAMTASVRTAAHVTTVAEVDMTELVNLRSEIKSQWKGEGINLTYVPFVIRAAVDGINQFPIMNSQIDDGSIVIKKYINFGVVVATQGGLINPVIKRVEKKNLKEIAKELERLTSHARDRKLSLDDIRGGTMTISNPGVFGAVLATPIIYQPQSSILWMGRIAKMPVVRDDTIVIRSMMYLCVSYDHRAVDGSTAAQFLQQIRKLLESPRQLLNRESGE